ncbi:MAG: KH domain-containing protein, partial [Patescibacteria group bacterium]|nr:KH domain-containing protein [Patescibacteria group bacterium]
MGQKVNPVSLRLTEKKNWQSRWFAQKDFALLFAEDMLLKRIATQKLGKTSGIERIEISRDAQEITLTISTSKPGVIIGRSGQGVEDLKNFLEKKLVAFREDNKFVFPSLAKLKDPKLLNRKLKIEILEIRVPELSAKIMAQNIAIQIEKRIAFRRAANQAINKIIEKGAKGVKINLSGRLGGAEIARRE